MLKARISTGAHAAGAEGQERLDSQAVLHLKSFFQVEHLNLRFAPADGSWLHFRNRLQGVGIARRAIGGTDAVTQADHGALDVRALGALGRT